MSERLFAMVLLTLAFTSAASGWSEPGGAIDFEQQIWPILEQSCLKCHGPKRQKGGLRLDQRRFALSSSAPDLDPVIVPGDSEGSLLYQLITSDDPEERMPQKRKDPLPPEEVELLRSWIDSGADWPARAGDNQDPSRHWAYQPPVRPPVPAGDPEWARHPIDAFVSARLRGTGLQPSKEADRASLIRRLSLDLTGLPPSPEQLDAFLADARPDAYERLVDALLASPHYGERLARIWLDLARYADSDGYEKDEHRDLWRYRDWVIEAFNADLPFDQFTTFQLAGDLLPEPTLEQRIATGFHRNTMLNKEGGADPEEFRVAAVLDRVNTTGAVFLGSTLECAQCHDHKYDPFSQREYYQLSAFFNSTVDVGNSPAPTLEAPTAQQLTQRPGLLAEQDELARKLTEWTPEVQVQARLWERTERERLRSWSPLHPEQASSENGTRLALLQDDSVLACGSLPDTDTYTVTTRAHLPRLTGLRLEILTDPSLPGGGPGRPAHGNFVLNDLRVSRVDRDGSEHPVALSEARADRFQTAGAIWAPRGIIDDDAESGWAVGNGIGAPHQVCFQLTRPVEFESGDRLVFRLTQTFGGGHLIGRLRFAATHQNYRLPESLLRPDVERLVRLAAERGEQAEQTLREHYLKSTPALEATRGRLSELDALLRSPTTMVMQELEQPRPTHVLNGANFLSPGEQVEPGVPAVLGSLPEGAAPNRLSLARWLVDERNPLVPRVAVNRFWSLLFGRGLVSTEGDFGSQGEPPTHPELLDWLAVEFVEQGFSVKQLLRALALSATYRQSSHVSAQALARDPENLLLARAGRFRLDGETIRDQALAISGRLAPAIGGPSVFPPQPEGTWAMTYSGEHWDTSSGPDRFRRGLYTYWRRTAPYPTYLLFDAPSRELTCTRRERTNTPLQALAVLNDPVFAELAQALAARILAEAELDDETRLAHGFRLCVARSPNQKEQALLTDLLRKQRTHFRRHPEAARQLAGEARDGDGSPLPAERAAWTVVANVLLNLDETLTRG